MKVLTSREKKIEEMLYNGDLGGDAIEFIRSLLDEKVACFLLGGAIRDAIGNSHPRDLDIMIADGSEIVLKKIIGKYDIQYSVNSFQGYKLWFLKTTVDVWFMRNHYVFKDNVYSCDKRYISQSTFLNYDSLVYDMTNKHLDSKYYDKCIQNKEIDFIGKPAIKEKNPNPTLSVIKLLLVKKRNDFSISNRVSEYIADLYIKNGEALWKILKGEYERHYKRRIDDMLLLYFKEQVLIAYSKHLNNQKGNIIGQYSVYDYICERQ